MCASEWCVSLSGRIVLVSMYWFLIIVESREDLVGFFLDFYVIFFLISFLISWSLFRGIFLVISINLGENKVCVGYPLFKRIIFCKCDINKK